MTWHETGYAESCVPPAPQLSIQIAGPAADDWISVDQAFLDTGADASLIPELLLSQIRAAEWDQA